MWPYYTPHCASCPSVLLTRKQKKKNCREHSAGQWYNRCAICEFQVWKVSETFQKPQQNDATATWYARLRVGAVRPAQASNLGPVHRRCLRPSERPDGIRRRNYHIAISAVCRHFGVGERDVWLYRCTQCAVSSLAPYPRKDGQAELTWVAGYVPRWWMYPSTDGHPSQY